MTYVFAIIGIISSFFIVKKREYLGDCFGDPEWASKIGGIYNLLTIIAVMIFFWSVASLTGTMDVLFAPIYMFLSFGRAGGGAPEGGML